jgi:opacity protein-like surface antigen
MKALIIASAVTAMSSFAFAATCPPQSQTVKSCRSTPAAGDQDFAARVFDSIAVCTQGSKVFMAFEKSGKQDVAEAKSQIRAGGSSFAVNAGGQVFSLSFTTGTATPSKRARFSVDFKQAGVQGSSTYTCQ